ncbi:hypothetical protein EYF80_021143 [Liparis tanakae]|uniref:Uncharacterized protein n=1 Tax=Liparis tanakae TaxID=230148 RepID=A0A4Z2HS07_9TELE|nr:hypothetical protein EYF80_021143 [Liparis tanakae]
MTLTALHQFQELVTLHSLIGKTTKAPGIKRTEDINTCMLKSLRKPVFMAASHCIPLRVVLTHLVAWSSNEEPVVDL